MLSSTLACDCSKLVEQYCTTLNKLSTINRERLIVIHNDARNEIDESKQKGREIVIKFRY